MNAKNIKAVLAKKHNDFVRNIEDKAVGKMVEKNSIVTGGCIVSMLLGEKVHDYDYYFTNKDTTIAVAQYFVNKFNKDHAPPNSEVRVEGDRVRIFIPSAGVAAENPVMPKGEEEESSAAQIAEVFGEADDLAEELLEDEHKDRYRPVFLSDNAITLSDKVQVIIRFYGDPDEIHENYDFIHCTSYWVSGDGQLVLRPKALESILTRQLTYVGSKYPICSIVRMRKFIRRGWSINAGQILKILFQISELDLTNIKVLEDQLTGVDTAYFLMLIGALKQRQEKDPSFAINKDYVATLVDKIFG